MSNPAKQKGTKWESDIVTYLAEEGLGSFRRRVLAGALDEGDIGDYDLGVTIEAKNVRTYSIGQWISEAEKEKKNSHAWLGVVWAHRQGKGHPRDGYVIMTGEQFVEVLKGIKG